MATKKKESKYSDEVLNFYEKNKEHLTVEMPPGAQCRFRNYGDHSLKEGPWEDLDEVIKEMMLRAIRTGYGVGYRLTLEISCYDRSGFYDFYEDWMRGFRKLSDDDKLKRIQSHLDYINRKLNKDREVTLEYEDEY